MRDYLNEYYEALERLIKGQPVRVPKGSKISFDTVAVEAGRGKGSIKRNRAVYTDLREAVLAAAHQQKSSVKNDFKAKAARNKAEAKEYRRRYEEALCRELALVHEVFELKRIVRKQSRENIIPIR